MSEYRVNLDIFAGPMDLLLYLVRKDEVDIYDIPIAHITEQYLKYIEVLKLLDIDLAGDFLVMAATLMEIKSAMLLPSTDIDEAEGESGDPRAELVRQLLEYKRFKDAANLLRDSAEQRVERYTRPDSIIAGLKKSDEPELDFDEVSVWMLLESFEKIMQSVGHYANYDHIKDDTPIDLYQIEILHRLQTEGPMDFESIFADRPNKLVMVGLFLAMLELIRDRLIWVEQAEALGPIYLKALTDVPAEKAVHDAIYSNVNVQEAGPTEDSGQTVKVTADEDDLESETVYTEETEEDFEDAVEIAAEEEVVVSEAVDIEEFAAPEEAGKNEAETVERQQPPIRIMELPAKQSLTERKEANHVEEVERGS